jgi:hypothetical protein
MNLLSRLFGKALAPSEPDPASILREALRPPELPAEGAQRARRAVAWPKSGTELRPLAQAVVQVCETESRSEFLSSVGSADRRRRQAIEDALASLSGFGNGAELIRAFRTKAFAAQWLPLSGTLGTIVF